MKLRIACIAVLLAFATASGAIAATPRNVTDPDAPRSLPEHGPVSVRWDDPAGFTEIRYSRNRVEARRGNWVEQLALHLRDRAQARLLAGQRLEVEIRDIQRAGDYEPWHGIAFNDTRVIRDLYPPRIALSFRHTGADGGVIAQGERRLSDPGFLMGARAIGTSDPLRFEKQLIDRWLARELAPPRT